MQYADRILGLLGEQDPLQVMQRTVPALKALLGKLPQALLCQPEAEGKWSIREVVQHMADTEMVYGYRLRLVLTLDEPRFNRFHQTAWAERFGYRDSDEMEAIEQLEALRRPNLRILQSLSPQDLSLIGIHSSRGPENLAQMMRLWAGHDLNHLAQIERIRGVSHQDAKQTGSGRL